MTTISQVNFLQKRNEELRETLERVIAILEQRSLYAHNEIELFIKEAKDVAAIR